MKFIPPCQPRLRDKPPVGPGWLHEVKFDGYRVQLHVGADGNLIYSKNGMIFNNRFSEIAAALAAIPCQTAIIDAEIVAQGSKGVPEFETLHTRQAAPGSLVVWAFDLLEYNGKDIRLDALTARRARLQKLVAKTGIGSLQFSEAFDDAQKLLAACEARKMEGIVSKRASAPYQSGPCKHWVKVKCAGWRSANRERFKLFERH